MVTTKNKGINVLPKEYIIAQKVVFYKKIIGAVVVLEVLCFIAFIALPSKNEVQETQDQLLYLQSEMKSERYAGVNKTLNELETAKADIQKWIDEYKSIKLDGYISGVLLDELVARIPSGVTIETVSVTDSEAGEDGNSEKTITIVGSSQKFNEAVSYLGILETVFAPGDIEHSITKGDKGKYTYTFTIKEIAAAAQADTGDAAQASSETSGEEDNQ